MKKYADYLPLFICELAGFIIIYYFIEKKLIISSEPVIIISEYNSKLIRD